MWKMSMGNWLPFELPKFVTIELLLESNCANLRVCFGHMWGTYLYTHIQKKVEINFIKFQLACLYICLQGTTQHNYQHTHSCVCKCTLKAKTPNKTPPTHTYTHTSIYIYIYIYICIYMHVYNLFMCMSVYMHMYTPYGVL
jgi:hypothetical protein